jgi:hypothetical protein
MPNQTIGPPVGLSAHAAATSPSASCQSEVSSNERCTWLVRIVYRRPHSRYSAIALKSTHLLPGLLPVLSPRTGYLPYAAARLEAPIARWAGGISKAAPS